MLLEHSKSLWVTLHGSERGEEEYQVYNKYVVWALAVSETGESLCVYVCLYIYIEEPFHNQPPPLLDDGSVQEKHKSTWVELGVDSYC